LCKHYFSDYAYFNIEEVSVREQIAADPRQFLERYAPKGIIIDEAHHYPELFSYIQVIADEHPEYRFVLTGSSNFALLHRITQSLAGRVVLFTLLPFSLSELQEQRTADTDTLMLNGGFPAVWANQIPAYDVCKSYYDTYIERDVRTIINVKDISKFQTFMRLCAGRIGCEFNASAFSNEIGVSVPTINEWLSVLEASYVVFRLKPFFRNIGKRLIKAPKIYFYDTGMVCYLNGIENEQQ
jgi:predicted AAA+ superfamily ATPase